MSRLDAVLQVAPGVRAVATRNVPHTLDVFTTHFPRFPVLPGVLILDDVVAVARLAVGGPDPVSQQAWTLCRTERVRFRHYVRPGDQMEITVRVQAGHRGGEGDEMHCEATVLVSGRRVATIQTLVLRRPDGAPGRTVVRGVHGAQV